MRRRNRFRVRLADGRKATIVRRRRPADELVPADYQPAAKTPTNATPAADLAGLQRVLGNQAMTRLLRPPGVVRHVSSRATPSPPPARSMFASRAPAQANVFRKQDEGKRERKQGTHPLSQRYVTTAGFKILGNRVKFTSTNIGATLAAGLQFNPDATNLEITSQDYDATGTVRAEGPKGRVKEFDLGMLQTVYRSDRTYYYQPDPYNPGTLEKIGTAIAPALFSNRFKITDTLSKLPVRDGDAGIVPWYEISDVASFDEATSSTKSTKLYDQPGTTFPWKQTVDGTDQYLVKTGGKDIFRTWLSVQEKGTSGFLGMHRLGYIDWMVDYGTDVTVNKANLAASVVTLTTGGGQILGINEGPGIKLPEMGDPVANDVTKEVKGWW